jgi:hypothetical protein
MQWPFVWDIQGVDPNGLSLSLMLHRSSRRFQSSGYALYFIGLPVIGHAIWAGRP